jgi:hypothetical protein
MDEDELLQTSAKEEEEPVILLSINHKSTELFDNTTNDEETDQPLVQENVIQQQW